MSIERHWKSKGEHPLTGESLSALLANEIPAVRIPQFANQAECAAFATAMRSGNQKFYGVDRPIGYIGMAQYEYRWGHAKQEYFAAVPKAFADQRYVFDRSFDPLMRFIDTLAAVWPGGATLAVDECGPYYAGIIRFASAGIDLHADYAPFNMPGYDVAKIDAQLAWNLFVEAPDKGGVTTLYNLPWSPAMTKGQPPQSYGLVRENMGSADAFSYNAVVGDVVIFNSRNPHEVSPGQSSGQDRLQIGSFVGRMPDTSLVLFA